MLLFLPLSLPLHSSARVGSDQRRKFPPTELLYVPGISGSHKGDDAKRTINEETKLQKLGTKLQKWDNFFYDVSLYLFS